MRAILIDDERLARQELRYMLRSFPEVEVLEEASHVDDALEKIHRLKPDLIFLDISMPEKSGFDLLEELDAAPQVIFVTAHDSFALKAFEENALDYLLKPTNPERLAKALTRVHAQIEQSSARESSPEKLGPDRQIFIKDGEKCYFLRIEEVFLIESVGNYARFFTAKEKPLLHKSLNLVQEKLDPAHFFRANRSQIINLSYVAGIESYFKGGLRVTLSSGDVVEMSSRNAVLFKEKMSF
ncbi:MAG: response regulator [Bacteroidetes bacterium]|nr:MAG: response regulator [Bacteroidota bacterium]